MSADSLRTRGPKATMVKIAYVAAFLTLAACASEKYTREVPTATSLAARSQANGDTAPMSDKLLAWQREGYKLINMDGENYFCRKETKTGSRLAHETVCLTEREMDSIREQTQRGLAEISRMVPPPQGK